MAKMKLQVGASVKVVNSLLYTGRTGKLVPAVGASEEGYSWDFHVELDAATPPPETSAIARKLFEARTIGVYTSQVEPLA